jgi:hypothetical protein
MYLCYVDESGTPEVPGTTSHYILAGLSVPIYHWKTCEEEVNQVKARYGMSGCEIHTGWLIRKYPEQAKIVGFDTLPYINKRTQVEALQRAELIRLQSNSSFQKKLKQTKKNYNQTKDYIHLTFAERKQFVMDIAQTIGNWGFSRLFAECIDKIFYDPKRAPNTVDEQAFEQIISRFQAYLVNSESDGQKNYGLIIHDNNQTTSKKHTELMKEFHKKGTMWTYVNNIIETPLFVDSTLTSMIQMADVCAYAIRRYLENNETALFDEVFKRADRRGVKVVGIRHFSKAACVCKICQAHKFTPAV